MELYILKSSVCLSIFYGFYKLLLEKESVHHFKRFYLLASLLFAFGIPLITFTVYIEVGRSLTTAPQLIPELTNNTETPIEITKTNYLPIVLWSVYGLGVLAFGLKFIKNILNLITIIQRNPKYKISHITNVLIQDLIVPHTFFNYIFLNKHKFETQQIPKEVLLHEETHAKQKHSLDVLYIETLQIIFWFNPLIYFIKHSIKLNHEFLADQAVLNQGFVTSKYQQVLLAFSSNASEPQLAHAINYSSIKKRFTIMKTQTSKQAFWLRSFILLPLVAFLIYSFSEKVIVEKTLPMNKLYLKQKNIEPILILMNFKGELLINNEKKTSQVSALKNKLNTLLNKLSNEQKKTLIVDFRADSESPKEAITNVKTILRELGILKVSYTQNYTYTASPKEIAEYNKLAKHDNTQSENNRSIELLELGYLELIYDAMTKEQKAKAESFPNYPPQQLSATSKQVKEYNKLANKYNIMSNDSFVVNNDEVKRLNYIYRIMTISQRKKAEPFPVFPPHPPAPAPAPQPYKIGKEVPAPPAPYKLREFIEVSPPAAPKPYKLREIVEVPPPLPTKKSNSFQHQIKLVDSLIFNFITTPDDKGFEIVLSDGTKVHLGKKSKLKYPTKFIKGEIRKVELLYGEAFFDATSGTPFKVIVKGKEIEVSGEKSIKK